jgi:hypothetical protein
VTQRSKNNTVDAISPSERTVTEDGLGVDAESTNPDPSPITIRGRINLVLGLAVSYFY